MQTMSLEEKVGQLLMVHFNGEVANEEARVLIQEVKVGGFIYYSWSNGLSSPEQVRTLSADLQRLTLINQIAIPLFIAIDQEGGVITRLTKGFTVFPGNRAIGEAREPSWARAAALAMGIELSSVGVNMNFAPVVDVNCNPINPIIGIRSFGKTPQLVSEMGRQMLEGYQEAKIIATLKHFPGHGDVETDSHENLPLVFKSFSELEDMELLPFRDLAQKADVVMTAHILLPAFDTEWCATLSKKTLGYLRKNLGFKGVIVSDSLVMEGVLQNCKSVENAAIQALNAGCDILLLGGKQLMGGASVELKTDDIKRIHAAIIQGVKDGQIPESRVNDAVSRILDLKERYLNAQRLSDEENFFSKLNSALHQDLAYKIAEKALKVVQIDSDSFQPIGGKKVVFVASDVMKGNLTDCGFEKIGKESKTLFFGGLNPDNCEGVVGEASDADIIIAFSYNSWKNPGQAALIEALIDTGKPVLVVVVRDDADNDLFPGAKGLLNTFSPTKPSLQVVARYLIEKE